LDVDAYDRSVTNKIASGVLANADNEIDTTTGTLKLRALFDNSKFELFPSQFVNVRLLLDTLHDVIVVPGAAMQQGSSGSYVYVVTENSTVKMRAITAGPASGDLISITKGLQPGETVVVDGADQLRDGARVILPSASGSSSGGSAAGGDASGSAASQHHHRPATDGSSGGGGQHFRHQQDDGASSAPPPASNPPPSH
jgi:multidrug efflux system membrane fusion protein